MKRKTLLTLLFGTIVWRVLLFVVAAIAPIFLAYRPTFPYHDIFLIPSGFPSWIYSWGNFDGVHYLLIEEHGYKFAGLVQAFFPVYPYLIKLLDPLYFSPLIAGISISAVATFLFLVMFYKLLRLDFDHSFSLGVLLLLAVFPTSFYFGAIYSEALFLLFVITAFWAARTKRWWLVAISTILATATRITGIFLVPSLLVEVWQQYRGTTTLISCFKKKLKPNSILKFFRKNAFPIFSILIGSLGLLSYMLFLKVTFGDPLLFYHVQSEFGSQRQESIILLPQTLWRGFKILLYAKPIDLKYYSYVQDFFITSAGLVGLLYALKTVRFSYVLFSVSVFLLPTLTGSLSSMPRYTLVAFALFIVLEQLLANKPLLRYTVLTLSALALIFNTILFVQGYWIA